MLLDNKANGRVADALTEALQPKSALSMISRAFSVFGYHELAKSLSRVNSLRYLIPAVPSFDGVPSLTEGSLTGTEAERAYRNRLNVASAARACHDWIHSIGEVRQTNFPVLQSLYHVRNGDGNTVAISGSSSFSGAGLGLVASRPLYLLESRPLSHTFGLRNAIHQYTADRTLERTYVFGRSKDFREEL